MFKEVNHANHEDWRGWLNGRAKFAQLVLSIEASHCLSTSQELDADCRRHITLVVPDIFLTSPASTASLGIGDLERPSNAATPSHGQAQVGAIVSGIVEGGALLIAARLAATMFWHRRCDRAWHSSFISVYKVEPMQYSTLIRAPWWLHLRELLTSAPRRTRLSPKCQLRIRLDRPSSLAKNILPRAFESSCGIEGWGPGSAVHLYSG